MRGVKYYPRIALCVISEGHLLLSIPTALHFKFKPPMYRPDFSVCAPNQSIIVKSQSPIGALYQAFLKEYADTEAQCQGKDTWRSCLFKAYAPGVK